MLDFVYWFSSLIGINLVMIQKDNGKEREELAKSMDKLHIEESPSGLAGSSSTNFKRKPVIIIVVGMAGNVIIPDYFWLFCLFRGCFF